MEQIILAFGLVLVIEGLVYALAPWLVESLLEAMKEMPLETRRRIGLVAVAIGVGLVWLAKGFG
ncbi:MAG TPA: DUF2065 domain-containing protein [Rhodobacteraceae bacterium]|nr:DUF2065 domain-containing protein [Paracoccaceae bacterium]